VGLAAPEVRAVARRRASVPAQADRVPEDRAEIVGGGRVPGEIVAGEGIVRMVIVAMAEAVRRSGVMSRARCASLRQHN
jgi:hypothetical protein